MQKIERKDLIFFGIIMLTAVIGEILFFYRQGDFMVDVGREFYLAKEVALGKLLYKDIFNIYGPLSYQINAVLFKIFGFHTDVLVYAGNLCGLVISGCMYVLSRQFLPSLYSFAITLFVVIMGIYNDWIFNFTVSYSYAMLYGLLAVMISLILLIKYVRNSEKTSYLYLSLFFAGMLVVLKYDYIPYLLVYVIVMFLERINLKTLLKGICAFSVVPVLSVIPLFFGGLSLKDVLFNVELLKKVSSAPCLKYFYNIAGVAPSLNLIRLTLFNLFFVSSIFCLFYLILTKIKTKWAYYVFLSLGLLFVFDLSLTDNMSFLSVLVTILVCALNKKITDKSHWILIAAALLLSVKTYLWSNLFMYGLYSFPFLLLCCIVLLKTYVFKNERVFMHCILVLLTIMSIYLLDKRFEARLHQYGVKVVTENGMIRTHRNLSPVKLLIEVMQKNINKDSTVVVLPEGHIINFLTGTKSDDFYSNFIPLYVEAFGEQDIINHYSKNMPDYFVLSTRDSSEYGYTYICKDYALNLCSWIFNNYHVVYKIVGEPKYTILRKN